MRRNGKHGLWQASIALVVTSLAAPLAPLSAVAETSIVGADQAAAAEKMLHQCSIFTPAQVVDGLNASSGITPPASFALKAQRTAVSLLKQRRSSQPSLR
jgi:hypothetical protein